MTKIWIKRINLAAILILCVIFVIKFGGPRILTSYVESGIGNCQTIPILCKVPGKDIATFTADKNYAQECIPYKFPKVEVCVPKGFKVVQELIKRPYYKKKRHHKAESVIYLLHQEPGYFPNLFPQLSKVGINDNYAFIKRIMFARASEINNLNDAFFVIMKSIFTPDIGDQKLTRMIQFKLQEKSGFVNYTTGSKFNYFDCSLVDKEGGFFKMYIRDASKELDLDKVMSIISTLTAGKQNA